MNDGKSNRIQGIRALPQGEPYKKAPQGPGGTGNGVF